MTHQLMACRDTGVRQLSTLEKARLHRTSGFFLMAIAHLRSEFEALSGWQSSHRRIVHARAMVQSMAARYSRAELREKCLECALLLREEGLCHQLLGHRLRSAYCTLFALEFLMHTIGVDQSLATELTPRIMALSDQLLTF